MLPASKPCSPGSLGATDAAPRPRPRPLVAAVGSAAAGRRARPIPMLGLMAMFWQQMGLVVGRRRTVVETEGARVELACSSASLPDETSHMRQAALLHTAVLELVANVRAFGFQVSFITGLD